jgi:ABC-type Fe3+ transport system substrate-binding protein
MKTVHWRAVLTMSLLLASACAAQNAGPVPVASTAATTTLTTQPAPSGELQTIVDGARQEGTLNLVWSPNAPGGVQGPRRIVDGLNKRHGLSIQVTFTPGPSMNDMAVRLAQERTAGRPASSDVFIGTEDQMKQFLTDGGLLPVDWVGLSAERILPSMLAPANLGVEMATRVPGVTYNAQLVSSERVPRTTSDLLKPEWKGTLASTPYGAFFDVLGSPEIWGPEQLLDFTRQLSGNLAGLIRCGETERLVGGEFQAFVFDCGDFEARDWQSKGAPIGHAIMRDAFALQYWWYAVPQHAAHPNTAMLFVLEAMSAEGQEMYWDESKVDQWKLPGSHVAPEIQAMQAEGAKLIEANVPFLMFYPEQAAVRKQVQDILVQPRP